MGGALGSAWLVVAAALGWLSRIFNLGMWLELAGAKIGALLDGTETAVIAVLMVRLVLKLNRHQADNISASYVEASSCRLL